MPGEHFHCQFLLQPSDTWILKEERERESIEEQPRSSTTLTPCAKLRSASQAHASRGRQARGAGAFTSGRARGTESSTGHRLGAGARPQPGASSTRARRRPRRLADRAEARASAAPRAACGDSAPLRRAPHRPPWEGSLFSAIICAEEMQMHILSFSLSGGSRAERTWRVGCRSAG